MGKIILLTLLLFLSNAYAVEVSEEERNTFADNFLTLGTSESKYGGDNFMKYDRGEIGSQIKTFIPPLLRPAFTQHAFVLPPTISSISVTQRYADINGDDFFKDGNVNKSFHGFKVNRQLTDIDILHGFDLDQKYLHGFTFRLNIPYLASRTDGHIHPNGQEFISIENAGSTLSLGDIGLFLKKKVFDQGNSPVGFAIAAAVFLPTGKNDETTGSNGRVTTTRPAVPNTTIAQGFDALQQQNVANGTWGDGRCFFSNFNADNQTLCNNNPSFGVPSAGPLSFVSGGQRTILSNISINCSLTPLHV